MVLGSDRFVLELKMIWEERGSVCVCMFVLGEGTFLNNKPRAQLLGEISYRNALCMSDIAYTRCELNYVVLSNEKYMHKSF